MQRSLVKPVYIVGMILIFSSLACGKTTQVVAPTPTKFIPSPTLEPSYTPFPTYTPRPSPTRRPTDTPLPTSTNIFQPHSTEVISGTTPINCVPGTTSGYNTCTDNSGMLQVDIPQTWTEVNGSTWTYQGHEIGVAISAAPNLEEFQSNFRTEGLFFGASGSFAQIYGHIELLDFYTIAYRDNCSYIGRFSYDDGVYRGKFDRYQKCGGEGGYDAYILSARDKAEPSTKLILIEIQAIPGDVSVRDQIWSSFFVYF